MQRSMKTGLSLLAVIWLVGVGQPAHATMLVRRLSLNEVTRDAARIVHGRVMSVRSGRDSLGLPATWITFAVARTLKGPAESELVVKQIGTTEPLPDGALGRVAGLPSYREGEEIIIFLRGTSARGFTSPVG